MLPYVGELNPSTSTSQKSGTVIIILEAMAIEITSSVISIAITFSIITEDEDLNEQLKII